MTRAPGAPRPAAGSTPSRRAVLVCLSALALAASGAVIHALWGFAGIPEGPLPWRWPGTAHGIWRGFFARWVPACYAAFTGLTLLVGRAAALGPADPPPRAVARLRALDRWSYLGLPLFWALELTWRWHGDWYLVFGGFFLALIALKTAAVLVALGALHGAAERAPERASDAVPVRHRRWLGASVLALFAVVYGFTSAWQIASISTTGDEPFYLLVTHSLVRDRDLDLQNNLARQEYRPFYWGRLAPHNLTTGPRGEVYAGAYTSALSVALAPGYALLGRRGATLVLDLFGALMAFELWRLARELTGRWRPALWAAATVGLTMPVLGMVPQVYPEVAGAWLFVVGLRALRRLGQGPSAVAALSLSVAGLPLLKSRFGALSLGLGLVAFARRGSRRYRLALITGLAGGAAAMWAVDRLAGGLLVSHHLRMRLAATWSGLRSQLAWTRASTDALLGLFFDQEFGLLWVAPVYLVALAGLPMLLRRYRGEVAAPLAIAGCYAYPMLTGHAFDWWGGWSSPARYWVVLLPLLGLLGALTIERLRSPATRAVAAGAVLWGVAVAFVTVLAPRFRYGAANGTAALAGLLGEWAERPFARLLPSLINPTPEGRVALSVIGVVLLVAAALLLVGARPTAEPVIGPWLTARTLAGGSLAAAVSFGVLLGLGGVVPTRRLEAEAMRATTGLAFHQHGLNVWVLKRSGALSAVAVLAGGPTRFEVEAAGDTTAPPGPRLDLWVDGASLGACELPATAAGWRAHRCAFVGDVPPGRSRLELRFTNGLEDRGSGARRHLYVDRIEIARDSRPRG